MTNWYEDPAFWNDMSGAMFTPARWENAATEMESVVGLLELRAGASVLDLCCGPGRHSLALHQLGMRPVGVDRHAPYLAAARAKADAIEWVEADMREFVREDAFDAVINMYSSFGYFEDPADDARVVAAMHRSLRAGGGILIDTMSKEVLAAQFQPRRCYELHDGVLLIEHSRSQPGWRGVETSWKLLRDDQVVATHAFRSRLYAGTELESLLVQGGFERVALYGALDGRPYDHEAKRLVVTARKASP